MKYDNINENIKRQVSIIQRIVYRILEDNELIDCITSKNQHEMVQAIINFSPKKNSEFVEWLKSSDEIYMLISIYIPNHKKESIFIKHMKKTRQDCQGQKGLKNF